MPLLRSSRRTFSVLFSAAMLSTASCLSIAEPHQGLSVFTITGGNNQVVVVSTAAPQPLTVRAIDETTGSLPGVTVTWEISSGTGVLSTASTVTDAGGQASVNFTAGSTPGPVLIRATAEDLRVTFTVDVVAQPPA